ncbi:MAG: SUMF1/EgtB/PvdO family nonheme iron enzyme [Rikenellaceae bacterium]|jgi:formylglycine-generating enzyme required for sulfatase activity|nr:SUMF1/EgtB/PvdO family nonheme iron enzyme [Rikenellaceae bacterium]
MNRIIKNSFAGAVATLFVAALLSPGSAFSSSNTPAPPPPTNNASQKTIRFVEIPSGTYKIGGGVEEIVADALPRHDVTLSDAFEISVEPVPYEAYRIFCEKTRKVVTDVGNDRGYVVGLNWYDAQAFCDWLNTPEGRSLINDAGAGSFVYRLPTEAEWEYCARNAKPFGVDRMCDLILREWCRDWYAPYTDRAVTDPQGPPEGMYKVVRGGYLDSPDRYNEYPLDLWRRGALPPNYKKDPSDKFNDFGRHNIGFRLVRSKAPLAANTVSAAQVAEIAAAKPLATLFVKQENNQSNTKITGKSAIPYFHKRYIFTAPPDNATHDEIVSLGLDPLFRHHHHSPGFTVCPNGDLLVTYYSSYHEYDAEVGLVTMRLRYGTDEWDMSSVFINPVGLNDHAPLIMTTDDGVIHHFWGWEQQSNAYPFQYISSNDNGATWGPVNFPVFSNVADRFDRQPINSAFRAKDGYFYIAADGNCDRESCTVVWRTKDMKTWENPKGRTGGRHTTLVELKDGGLLGLGGKNSQINGFMPQSVSYDHGDTWKVTQSVFPALAGGQRPSVTRLQSGLLVMCGDYKGSRGATPYPADEPREGIYVAYSGDEGATWTFKTIPGAQRNKSSERSYFTVGYSDIQQSEDGMIHLITSRVHPCIHFSFNEAWLLNPDANAGEATNYGWRPAVGDDATLMGNTARQISQVQTYRENYPSTRQVKYEYSGGTADDGRFLLHGPERWYYPSGALMMECNYILGKRSGRYAYYTEAGSRIWEWDYKPSGLAVYRTFYPDEADGRLKSVAAFRSNIAQGCAQIYSRTGALLKETWYKDGHISRVTDLRTEKPAVIEEVY